MTVTSLPKTHIDRQYYLNFRENNPVTMNKMLG